MRSKHAVHAPAVIGAPEFERAFRVQMNFLIGGVAVLGLLVLSIRLKARFVSNT